MYVDVTDYQYCTKRDLDYHPQAELVKLLQNAMSDLIHTEEMSILN